MDKFEEILYKYWGYKSFRPLQKEIIEQAYNGNDVLGLLPTGGGKSIIFQVAGLSRGGLTLVITPLIALMKDQVENLKKAGIEAAALFTGMEREELTLNLQNAVDGKIKFLYISPERLMSVSFRGYLKNMDVTLIAVDEAHCISQWGYDFRPPYLRIAEIREMFPQTPVLAVTATATPDVVDDIQEKLRFKKKNVFKKSFERKNLIYIVKETENKLAYLVKTLKKTGGSGVVYVRSRKKTKEIAELLKRQGISADYYHAGLSQETRNKKQEAWKQDKTRIIVATNAFGMGIDKPDVRFVIHIDVPESIEAYFQEAGRAGRDGKKAFAVLLYNNTDKVKLKQYLNKSFPTKDFIKRVYEALHNFFEIPEGEGESLVREFDFYKFVKDFKLPPVETFNALKILQQEGYFTLSEAFYTPSKIKFKVNKLELYEFQMKHPDLDGFIKTLLRTYSGVFTQFVKINEKYLASKLKTEEDKIVHLLRILNKYHVITYVEASDSPKIVFHTNRLNAKHVIISKENYEDRKERYGNKIDAILNYATNKTKCRSKQLVEYFGQTKSYRCGECDVCRSRNELDMTRYEFDEILDKIKSILKKERVPLTELVARIDFDDDKTIKVIDWLFETGKIEYDERKLLKWHK